MMKAVRARYTLEFQAGRLIIPSATHKKITRRITGRWYLLFCATLESKSQRVTRQQSVRAARNGLSPCHFDITA